MPTGRTGRLLALGILIATLAILYLSVVAPLIDLYDQGAATLADRRLLQPRLHAAAARVPALQEQLAGLSQRTNTRKLTIDGASDALASAGLQSRIEELATAAGVSIGSTEALPAEARGLYRRVGLRMSINGAYANIVELLAAIEASTPPLVLDNLQIHGAMRAIAKPADRLDAGFEVYGFRSSTS